MQRKQTQALKQTEIYANVISAKRQQAYAALSLLPHAFSVA